MDGTRFDGISKLLAEQRLSRRRAVRHGAAGLAAAGLAAAGLRAAAAQEATPATGVTPTGDQAANKIQYLFLQSFESGKIAPKTGADGVYTVTLQHGLGQTLFFSDRPERIVGAAPTPTFLKGLGFAPDNPPNAALLVDAGDGALDIAVVELTNPSYDQASSTATYDLAVLQNYQRTADLQFQEAPKDLSSFPASFGGAHLFIDDCPDGKVDCCLPGYQDNYGTCAPDGVRGSFYPVGMCWSWSMFECVYCRGLDYYQAYCNNGGMSTDCTGACIAVPADVPL
jgi:hypothetical protein